MNPYIWLLCSILIAVQLSVSVYSLYYFLSAFALDWPYTRRLDPSYTFLSLMLMIFLSCTPILNIYTAIAASRDKEHWDEVDGKVKYL